MVCLLCFGPADPSPSVKGCQRVTCRVIMVLARGKYSWIYLELFPLPVDLFRIVPSPSVKGCQRATCQVIMVLAGGKYSWIYLELLQQHECIYTN